MLRTILQVIQAIPIFFCICSNEISFVSGYHNKTTKNWITIMSAKKMNGKPPEDAAATAHATALIAAGPAAPIG